MFHKNNVLIDVNVLKYFTYRSFLFNYLGIFRQMYRIENQGIDPVDV
jgi:hypothetical protein